MAALQIPAAARAAAYPDLLHHLPGITGLMARLITFWVFGTEVMLCYGLGARAVRLNRLIWGMLFMLPLNGIAFLAEGSRGYEMLAVTIMVVVAFLHRNAAAWDTLKSGADPTHTWFMGDSVLVYLKPQFPRFAQWLLQDPWVVYRFVHPILLIGLGLLVFALEGSLVVAFYLIGSGIFSGGKNGLLFSALVDMVLDQFDAGLSRYHMPRLIERATSGPGRSTPHAGMPLAPGLIEILRSVPSADMEGIVREAMTTNGTNPDRQAQEQPHG